MNDLLPHVTRPKHFIFPIMLLMVAGWTGSNWIGWVGLMLALISVLITIWLVIDAVLVSYRQTLDDLYALEKIKRQPLPAESKVEITSKVETVGRTTWKYQFLDIHPEKLKQIAQLSISGRPFAIRSMTGKGKPLSDPEFRKLKDDLLEYGYIRPRSEKDERQGVEWTEQGWMMLKEVAGIGDGQD